MLALQFALAVGVCLAFFLAPFCAGLGFFVLRGEAGQGFLHLTLNVLLVDLGHWCRAVVLWLLGLLLLLALAVVCGAALVAAVAVVALIAGGLTAHFLDIHFLFAGNAATFLLVAVGSAGTRGATIVFALLFGACGVVDGVEVDGAYDLECWSGLLAFKGEYFGLLVGLLGRFGRLLRSSDSGRPGFGRLGFGGLGFGGLRFRSFGFGSFGFRSFGFRSFGFRSFGFRSFGFRSLGFRSCGFGGLGLGGLRFGRLGLGGLRFGRLGLAYGVALGIEVYVAEDAHTRVCGCGRCGSRCRRRCRCLFGCAHTVFLAFRRHFG